VRAELNRKRSEVAKRENLNVDRGGGFMYNTAVDFLQTKTNQNEEEVR